MLGCLSVSGSDTPRPPRKQETSFLVGTGGKQAKNMSFHTNSLARANSGLVSVRVGEREREGGMEC